MNLFSFVFIGVSLLVSMVHHSSSQLSKSEGACSKTEGLQKKLREKTPIGMLAF
jgi:hypothetical protein